MCRTKSVAEKNYLRRMMQTMAGYLLVVMCTTLLVRHGGVTGWSLYVFAILPAIPVLRLLHVVALYLHEERDEYQRLLVVRAILCGTTVVLMVVAFTDFLRSYTPYGTLPPFTLFVVFWMVFGLAHWIQQRSNGVGDDDQQTA